MGESSGEWGGLPVEDRIAIQDLIARYAWALDTGDIDSLVDCFTPDAVVIEEVFEDPDRWEGHEGIRRLGEHYAASPGFPGRQHHVSQSIVEGSGEHCTVKSFAFVTECRGEPPYTLRFTGYYDDQLVKADGRWLFQERVIRLWDGPVLARFPGRGERVARKRPPELTVKRGTSK
jgi:ketosteroid isomerase-like protein